MGTYFHVNLSAGSKVFSFPTLFDSYRELLFFFLIRALTLLTIVRLLKILNITYWSNDLVSQLANYKGELTKIAKLPCETRPLSDKEPLNDSFPLKETVNKNLIRACALEERQESPCNRTYSFDMFDNSVTG